MKILARPFFGGISFLEKNRCFFEMFGEARDSYNLSFAQEQQEKSVVYWETQAKKENLRGGINSEICTMGDMKTQKNVNDALLSANPSAALQNVKLSIAYEMLADDSAAIMTSAERIEKRNMGKLNVQVLMGARFEGSQWLTDDVYHKESIDLANRQFAKIDVLLNPANRNILNSAIASVKASGEKLGEGTILGSNRKENPQAQIAGTRETVANVLKSSGNPKIDAIIQQFRGNKEKIDKEYQQKLAEMRNAKVKDVQSVSNWYKNAQKQNTENYATALRSAQGNALSQNIPPKISPVVPQNGVENIAKNPAENVPVAQTFPLPAEESVKAEEVKAAEAENGENDTKTKILDYLQDKNFDDKTVQDTCTEFAKTFFENTTLQTPSTKIENGNIMVSFDSTHFVYFSKDKIELHAPITGGKNLIFSRQEIDALKTKMSQNSPNATEIQSLLNTAAKNNNLGENRYREVSVGNDAGQNDKYIYAVHTDVDGKEIAEKLFIQNDGIVLYMMKNDDTKTTETQNFEERKKELSAEIPESHILHEFLGKRYSEMDCMNFVKNASEKYSTFNEAYVPFWEETNWTEEDKNANKPNNRHFKYYFENYPKISAKSPQNAIADLQNAQSGDFFLVGLGDSHGGIVEVVENNDKKEFRLFHAGTNVVEMNLSGNGQEKVLLDQTKEWLTFKNNPKAIRAEAVKKVRNLKVDEATGKMTQIDSSKESSIDGQEIHFDANQNAYETGFVVVQDFEQYVDAHPEFSQIFLQKIS